MGLIDPPLFAGTLANQRMSVKQTKRAQGNTTPSKSQYFLSVKLETILVCCSAFCLVTRTNDIMSGHSHRAEPIDRTIQRLYRLIIGHRS